MQKGKSIVGENSTGVEAGKYYAYTKSRKTFKVYSMDKTHNLCSIFNVNGDEKIVKLSHLNSLLNQGRITNVQIKGVEISQHYVFTNSRRVFKVIAIHYAENKCFTIDLEDKESIYRLSYLNSLLFHGELKPVDKKLIEIHKNEPASEPIKKGGHYRLFGSSKIFKVVTVNSKTNSCTIAYVGEKHEKVSLSQLERMLREGHLEYIGMTAYESSKNKAVAPDADKLKLNSKKCRIFIQSLSDTERIYCGHIIDIVLALRQLIGEEKDGKMSVSEFCKHFNIQPNKYIKFIGGDWEYALEDTVRLTMAQQIVMKRQNAKRI